jgi:Flp pilus assembly protein TadD
MVLGRAEMRIGRHAEARTAFERAAVLYPQSQAALVALSHVALVEGRGADAVTAVERALGPGPPKAEDVWATYFRQHAPDARSYLDELEGMIK